VREFWKQLFKAFLLFTPQTVICRCPPCEVGSGRCPAAGQRQMMASRATVTKPGGRGPIATRQLDVSCRETQAAQGTRMQGV
jgi:hypothetical protein